LNSRRTRHCYRRHTNLTLWICFHTHIESLQLNLVGV
jgi:hypothetical protein